MELTQAIPEIRLVGDAHAEFFRPLEMETRFLARIRGTFRGAAFGFAQIDGTGEKLRSPRPLREMLAAGCDIVSERDKIIDRHMPLLQRVPERFEISFILQGGIFRTHRRRRSDK